MKSQQLAESAYAATNAPVRSARRMEYEVIARITHRLKDAARHGNAGFPALVKALHDNRALWTTLAADVSDSQNGLPEELRARILFLSEFTQRHSSLVLNDKASIAPLLEINTAVLRGLRQEASGR